MSTRDLRPGTAPVEIHPDVDSGALTEATFAVNLGAIDGRP